jgi:hypothetical protein
MELAVGLSLNVRPALPALVEAVIDEARAFGYVFSRKRADETSLPDRSLDVSRLVGMH